jgi:hypothetical protein
MTQINCSSEKKICASDFDDESVEAISFEKALAESVTEDQLMARIAIDVGRNRCSILFRTADYVFVRWHDDQPFLISVVDFDKYDISSEVCK